MEFQYVGKEVWLPKLFRAIDDVVEDEERRARIKDYFNVNQRTRSFNKRETQAVGNLASFFIYPGNWEDYFLYDAEPLLNVIEQIVAMGLLDNMRTVDMDFKRLALFFDGIERAVENCRDFYDK